MNATLLGFIIISFAFLLTVILFALQYKAGGLSPSILVLNFLLNLFPIIGIVYFLVKIRALYVDGNRQILPS